MNKLMKGLYAAEIASLAVCAAASVWAHNWTAAAVCGVAAMNCANAIVTERRASRAEELSALKDGLLDKYRKLCVKCGIFPEGSVPVIVAENPNKTYLEDFREKHPDAPMGAEGMPTCCIEDVYGAGAVDLNICERYDCAVCWNRKMKKGDGE